MTNMHIGKSISLSKRVAVFDHMLFELGQYFGNARYNQLYHYAEGAIAEGTKLLKLHRLMTHPPKAKAYQREIRMERILADYEESNAAFSLAEHKALTEAKKLGVTL